MAPDHLSFSCMLAARGASYYHAPGPGGAPFAVISRNRRRKDRIFVARRNNYSFEKRQKENKRKQKQAEKLERKRLKKLEETTEETPAAPADPAAPEQPVPVPMTEDAAGNQP